MNHKEKSNLKNEIDLLLVRKRILVGLFEASLRFAVQK